MAKTSRLIQSPSGTAKNEPAQKTAAVIQERPGQHGPVSGTTGAGPQKPPTPGKIGKDGE